MSFQTIRIEDCGGGIKLIQLSRPDAKNALSILMRREISEALDLFRDDKKTGAVIFTGGGDVFCAGFDLKEFGRPEIGGELFESSAKYHRDVFNFPKPTIASINGAALGGGFDLATLCDIRLCSENATFAHPEIKFGGPPLFTPLRWIVGHGMARDLCLTGRKIGAEEALRIGLVSEIAPRGELARRAVATAKLILQAPSETLAMTKAYMIWNAGKDFEQSFTTEHDDIFRKFLGGK